jgi:hypothetical protein
MARVRARLSRVKIRPIYFIPRSSVTAAAAYTPDAEMINMVEKAAKNMAVIKAGFFFGFTGSWFMNPLLLISA